MLELKVAPIVLTPAGRIEVTHAVPKASVPHPVFALQVTVPAGVPPPSTIATVVLKLADWPYTGEAGLDGLGTIVVEVVAGKTV